MYKFERHRQLGLDDFNQPVGLKLPRKGVSSDLMSRHYITFPLEETCRTAQKLDVYYTPKHSKLA